MDQIAGVVEIMDAEDEGRRAARREGNRLRQAARRQRDAGHDGSRVTVCDAKPVTRDPSPEEKRKASPCTPSKEKTQPSPNFTPSVPKGTSSPSATDCDAADRQEELAEALAAFNRMAAEVGLPEAQGMSRKRRLALKARLRDCGGIAGWRIAMDRVRASPFLRGDNDRGWRASLDFLLKPESFAKLMEGAYDPAPGARRQRAEPRSSMATAMAEVLLEHPDSEFGKRARAAGFRRGDFRGGGDAIIAGMARVAEQRFGQWPGSSDGRVIDGAADELFGDYSDV
ncbi:hypothetical protein FHT36_001923 [Xanthobacter sp. SG618]|uniref:hypothetical protein n=1 Tax=Xanthobacter sp. SG618 TaxID=2587121 RepID=UPI00145C92C0|nr:hypothetical protein [Xanthobacter sp. SG618]NMN58021.1 hypothetical protein [Xanthobacter sp. SG618]